MICPKCNFEQADSLAECSRCRVIFAKIRSLADKDFQLEVTCVPVAVGVADNESKLCRWRELLTAVEPGESPLFATGRGVLLALMLVWGWRFVTASIASGYATDTPLHLIHLPFHEAGHVIFGVAGFRFLAVLGGTLGQLLVPAIISGAFVMRRNPFGGAVGLWWLGQSLMDVAIYANDARSGQLLLLGGVTGSEVEDYHDWEFMLGKLGWLAYDHLIAKLIYVFGALAILSALAWGSFLVWQQSRLLLAGHKR